MKRSAILLLAAALLAATPASAQSLSGVELGAPLSSTSAIGFKPSASNEMGPHSVRRWTFPDGNELSVTALRSDGRIVYMESSWGGRVPGSPTDYPGVRFGETTLDELRSLMGSNGFSYKTRVVFEDGNGGVATANSYQIAGKPGQILTFVSLVKADEVPLLQSGRRKLGNLAKVDSLIIGESDYLDGAWGREKGFDPKARPIVWGAVASNGEPAAAAAEQPSGAVAAFVRALECKTTTEPAAAIRPLQKEGVIGTKPDQVIDGIPSFQVRRPFTFHGTRVVSIEGWSPNGKGLFLRGPGTAPPTHLAATVEGERKDVEGVLGRNGIQIVPYVEGRPNLGVDEAEYYEPKLTAKFRGRKLSSVGCSYGY